MEGPIIYHLLWIQGDAYRKIGDRSGRILSHNVTNSFYSIDTLVVLGDAGGPKGTR